VAAYSKTRGATSARQPLSGLAVPAPRQPIDDMLVSRASRERTDGRRAWSRLAAIIAAADVASALVASAVVACFGWAGPWTLLVGAVALGALRQAGLQRQRLAPLLLDDLPVLLACVLFALGVVCLVRVAAGQSGVEGSAVFSGFLVFFLVLGRLCLYGILRYGRGRGHYLHPTIIVGGGALTDALASALLADPHYGLLPIGVIQPSDRPLTAQALPRLGSLNSLRDIVRVNRAHVVLLTDVAYSSDELTSAVRACDGMHITLFFVPRLWEMSGVVHGAEMVRGIPVTRLRRPVRTSPAWRFKRYFDVIASGLSLILISPLLAVCALLIRREGGPGIIFRQERVGEDGRLFSLLKFRSIRPVDETESATLWSVAADARMGPIGRAMRRWSIDELPQLWNVLRGDMSLIGPRPERPYFVSLFSGQYREYADRQRVPCGLTGWAQIHGLRGDTSIAGRARYDNYYIENWSFWLDMKILLRTVKHVLSRAGG
jgi:exopolysaccharide biosynthesis polyprenyl glycosylphosphotransferase